MREQPLVSIITPTYNHERFIGQCIESVLAQTYPHWEQIIIDDSSTDRTGEIASKYCDERIKYVRQDHVGIWKLGVTYNRALQISQGEFIAILEGDDFWPPYKLEKQLLAFEEPEVVLSWGKQARVNVDGRIIAVLPKNLRWFRHRRREEILKKLLFENFIPASTAICRRDTLLSVGGFIQPEYVPFADHPTWLELSLLGEFSAADEVMGYWRQHGEQASTTMKMTMFTEGLEYSIEFFQRLPSELRDSLGVSVNDLVIAKQHATAKVFLDRGRVALIDAKWKDARGDFLKAFRKGSFSTRLRALLGLFCGCCRLDMEWAATLARRPRLK